MDPFKGKNPFENMGNMNQNPFSSDYLDQVKEMMDQYNSVLNEDFWTNMNGMGNPKKRKKMSGFPVEMWESDDQLFVLAYIPGVRETRQVKTSFISEKKINIKSKLLSEQPPTAKRQLATEMSDSFTERDVILPYEVESDNYSINVEKGITTLIFSKVDSNENVPFDF